MCWCVFIIAMRWGPSLLVLWSGNAPVFFLRFNQHQHVVVGFNKVSLKFNNFTFALLKGTFFKTFPYKLCSKLQMRGPVKLDKHLSWAKYNANSKERIYHWDFQIQSISAVWFDQTKLRPNLIGHFSASLNRTLIPDNRGGGKRPCWKEGKSGDIHLDLA